MLSFMGQGQLDKLVKLGENACGILTTVELMRKFILGRLKSDYCTELF